MRRIIYREDGGISVIIPAPKSKREDETEAEWLKRVFDKATPEGAEFEDVGKDKIPQDREFRGAWTGKKGKGISVDKVKKLEMINEKTNLKGE